MSSKKQRFSVPGKFSLSWVFLIAWDHRDSCCWGSNQPLLHNDREDEENCKEKRTEKPNHDGWKLSSSPGCPLSEVSLLLAGSFCFIKKREKSNLKFTLLWLCRVLMLYHLLDNGASCRSERQTPTSRLEINCFLLVQDNLRGRRRLLREFRDCFCLAKSVNLHRKTLNFNFPQSWEGKFLGITLMSSSRLELLRNALN